MAHGKYSASNSSLGKRSGWWSLTRWLEARRCNAMDRKHCLAEMTAGWRLLYLSVFLFIIFFFISPVLWGPFSGAEERVRGLEDQSLKRVTHKNREHIPFAAKQSEKGRPAVLFLRRIKDWQRWREGLDRRDTPDAPPGTPGTAAATSTGTTPLTSLRGRRRKKEIFFPYTILFSLSTPPIS